MVRSELPSRKKYWNLCIKKILVRKFDDIDVKWCHPHRRLHSPRFTLAWLFNSAATTTAAVCVSCARATGGGGGERKLSESPLVRTKCRFTRRSNWQCGEIKWMLSKQITLIRVLVEMVIFIRQGHKWPPLTSSDQLEQILYFPPEEKGVNKGEKSHTIPTLGGGGGRNVIPTNGGWSRRRWHRWPSPPFSADC